MHNVHTLDINHDEGWTVHALREHLLELREADKKYFGEAIEYADRALEIVQQLVMKYEALLIENKFNFLTRSEYDAKHELLRTEIDRLNSRLTIIEGNKAGRSQGWLSIAAAISVLLNILLIAKLLH